MTVNVKNRFVDVSANDVRTGKVPSAYDWKNFGENVAYLNGVGSNIMPFAAVEHHVSGNSTTNFSYNIYDWIVAPTKNALERTWVVQYQGINPRSSREMRFGVNNNPELAFTGTTADIWVNTKVLRETVTFSGSIMTCSLSAATVIDPNVVPDGAIIRSVGAWDIPRVQLDPDNSEEGVMDYEALVANTIIHHDLLSPPVQAPNAVLYHTSGSLGRVRRTGLFYWIAPTYMTGVLNTALPSFGATVGSLFDVAPRIQMRKIFRNDTKQRVWVYARLWSASNIECEMILSSSDANGGVANNFKAISLTANVPGWISCSIDLPVDGASGSALPDGLEAMPSLDVQFRALTAGSIRVASISVVEPEEGKQPR